MSDVLALYQAWATWENTTPILTLYHTLASANIIHLAPQVHQLLPQTISKLHCDKMN